MPARPAYDALVVGAGFAGSVVAERLASQLAARVLVVDRRSHVAGNAHDYVDDHGVLVHRYGPHIFHAGSQRIVDYLSQFTDWRPYEHRVLASVDGKLLPLPINLDTINTLYGLSLDSDGLERFFAERAEPIARPRTSEEVVVSRVGRDLYERFYRGYTRKQWGVEASELAASVTARIPIRTDRDDRYFTDSFQKIPAGGYTRMFERMLGHPNIEVRLDTTFDAVRDEVDRRHTVYTGPIDAFFGHRFGRLPYRSLRFELTNVATPGGELVQPVAQINQPNDHRYTRTTEFRHITGQRHTSSTIAYEYPTDEGDPYYPVPRDENRELYKRYAALAATLPDVTFVGRLARYQYLNMDQVVGQALAAFEHIAATTAVAA
jgi:UDP-galactopyranose mutase